MAIPINKKTAVQDIKNTYAKGIASGQTKEQVIGAMKDKLKSTGQYDAVKTAVAPNPIVSPITGSGAIVNSPTTQMPVTQTQDQLKAKIATGNFSASEAKQYNQMTGSQTGTRDVALTSPQALQSGTFQTTVTQPEAQMMKESGITAQTPISQGITKEQPVQTEGLGPQKMTDITGGTGIMSGGMGNPNEKVTPTNNITEAITPKYQQQLDKVLETTDIASTRAKLKEGLANGTIDKATYDKSEAYLWDKVQEQSNIGKDENAMFQSLQVGQKIQPQFTQTPEASKAQARFDISNKYQGMGEDQLYQAYINGEIGSQLEKDIAGNPALGLAKEKYNRKLATDDINNNNSSALSIYNKNNGKETTATTEKTYSETINDKLMSLFTNMGKSENELVNFRDYMANNYPDLVTKTTELNAKNKQLKELTDARDARLDEIIKENPGISINRAIMLAARQNKDTNNEIKSLTYELSNLSADIQYQTMMADKEYGYMQQDQARQDKLAQEQRGYAFDYLKGEQGYQRGLEAEKRQQDFATQQSETNFNRSLYAQELQNQYQNSKDVQNYEQDLAKMGIQNANAIDMNNLNFKQQKELIAIQNKYADSKDVQNYNQQLNAMNYKYNLENPTQGASGQLQTYKQGNKTITLDSNAGTALSNVLAKVPNAIVGSTFRTAEEQKKLYDAYKNGTGGQANAPGTSLHEKGLAVDIYSGTDKNGKLLAPDANLIKEMNANGWYQTAGKNDMGHFEFKGVQGGEKQYNDSDIALLSSVTKLDKQGKETLRDNGYTEKEWANFTAGLLPATKRQKTDAKVIVDKVDDILAGDWTDAVGPFLGKSRVFTGGGTDRKVTELKVAALKDLLAMANLDKIKGAMSDKDIEFLRNTATYLSTDLSETEFEKTLNEIKSKYSGISGGGTSTDARGKVYNFKP